MFQCDESLHTCPDQPKNDPIHNFMNYADDHCLTEFTPGQGDRMRLMVGTYRAMLVAPAARANLRSVSGAASCGCGTAARTVAVPAAPRAVIEGYPDRLAKRVETRNTAIAALASRRSGHAAAFTIGPISQTWRTGQTLKVAFKGGDTLLHERIAETVNEWTDYANLQLDFGYDSRTGQYRTWSPSDTTFGADIRVSFDQIGYYSLVGNDSINLAVTKPGEESLNLQGFDVQLPDDWQAVARHEFGHAIGFQHEHQQPIPTNPCDFRFEDDPGYSSTTDTLGQYIPDSQGRRPGLYTMLGGPPNNWSKETVDFNLRKLSGDSHAYVMGPFDKSSIMKYYFPDWMLVSGAQSGCYTATESSTYPLRINGGRLWFTRSHRPPFNSANNCEWRH